MSAMGRKRTFGRRERPCCRDRRFGRRFVRSGPALVTKVIRHNSMSLPNGLIQLKSLECPALVRAVVQAVPNDERLWPATEQAPASHRRWYSAGFVVVGRLTATYGKP
jgi:hypothetical protein